MIKQMVKVEQRGRFWVVLVASPVTGGWIVGGEHMSKQAAERDARMYRDAA